MKATDLIRQTVDWFIPAEQRGKVCALRRARIVVAPSCALVVWGPPLAAVSFVTPGSFWNAVVTDVESWHGEARRRHVASGTSIDVHLNILFVRDPRGQDTLWIEAVPGERKSSLAPALSCNA